jgi:hypothetical protein
MAITSVKEQLNGRESERGSKSRSAKREWIVETDDKEEFLPLIEAAIPVAIGSLLDGDTSRRVGTIRSQYISDSKYAWRVTAEYETPQSGGGGGGGQDSSIAPISRAPDIQLDWDESRQPFYVDADGTPVANSAGLTFDPPIDNDIADPVLVITRNEFPIDWPLILSYRNAINLDTYLGAAVGTLRLYPILASRNFEQEWGYFYRVTYRLGYREDGWLAHVLDEGRYAAYGDDIIPIVDGNGDPVTDPVRLDGGGGQLAAGQAAVFRDFKRFKSKLFAPLNLPTDF